MHTDILNNQNAEIDPSALKINKNLEDLSSVPEAWDNLGLGECAGMERGTSAGTLSEGNHTHSSTEVTTFRTKIIFVDSNRADDYTPDGTVIKPYKTLASAIDVTTVGDTIIFSGLFSEIITLPAGVNLFGIGLNNSTIDGILTIANNSQTVSIRDFTCTTININGNCNIDTVDCSRCVVNAYSINVFANNFNVSSSTLLTFEWKSSGNFLAVNCKFLASTNTAIWQYTNIGKIKLVDCEIIGNKSDTAAILSETGRIDLINCSIVNNLNDSIFIDNDSTELNPNNLIELNCTGDINCNDSFTHISYIKADSIIGTNLVYTPASMIANDSSVTGVNVKEALESLDGGGGGSLPSGLENETLRHNGTTWEANDIVKIYENSIKIEKTVSNPSYSNYSISQFLSAKISEEEDDYLGYKIEIKDSDNPDIFNFIEFTYGNYTIQVSGEIYFESLDRLSLYAKSIYMGFGDDISEHEGMFINNGHDNFGKYLRIGNTNNNLEFVDLPEPELQTLIIVKSEQEIIANSNDIQDDNELFFLIENGKRYLVEGVIIVGLYSDIPDFRFVFSTIDAFYTCIGTYQILGENNIGGIVGRYADLTIGQNIDTSTLLDSYPNNIIIRIDAILTANYDGTVKFAWSPLNITDDSVWVNANSFLKITCIE